MMLFDAASQPEDSRITVQYTDTETTTLIFPRFSAWQASLVCMAMGVLVLVWHWGTVVGLIQLNEKAWRQRGAVQLCGVGVTAILLGTAFLLSGTKLEVSARGIGLFHHLLGLKFFNSHARFAAIRDITCEMRKGQPLIRVSYEDDSFAIGDFCSAEERDWVAEGLTKAWQQSKANSPQDS